MERRASAGRGTGRYYFQKTNGEVCGRKIHRSDWGGPLAAAPRSRLAARLVVIGNLAMHRATLRFTTLGLGISTAAPRSRLIHAIVRNGSSSDEAAAPRSLSNSCPTR